MTAAITSAVLLAVVVVTAAGAETAATGLLAAQAGLFAIAAVAGIRWHPYGIVFRRLVRPRLGPPSHLEDRRHRPAHS